MDKFEHQFETLDVQTQQMEDTMSNTTTLTTPQVRIEHFFLKRMILNYVSKLYGNVWFSSLCLLWDIAATEAFLLFLCGALWWRDFQMTVTSTEDPCICILVYFTLIAGFILYYMLKTLILLLNKQCFDEFSVNFWTRTQCSINYQSRICCEKINSSNSLILTKRH